MHSQRVFAVRHSRPLRGAAVLEPVEPRLHLDGDGEGGPIFVIGSFEYAIGQYVQYTFDRNIAPASVTTSDVQILNLTTNQLVPAAQLVVSFPSTQTARFELIAPPLADGNYVATLPAGSITDFGGDPLATDAVIDFWFLGADPTRDRVVNLADFAVLRANFGQSPRSFDQGDFNYDGDVNLTDFGILRAQFGKTLPPPTGPTAGPGAGGLFAGGDGSSDDDDDM